VTVRHDFKNLKLFICDSSLSAEISYSYAWFIDSSASIHMSCYMDWFETYHENKNGSNIYLGDDRTHQIKFYVYICVTFPTSQEKQI
jgi:hypothetical protein